MMLFCVPPGGVFKPVLLFSYIPATCDLVAVDLTTIAVDPARPVCDAVKSMGEPVNIHPGERGTRRID